MEREKARAAKEQSVKNTNSAKIVQKQKESIRSNHINIFYYVIALLIAIDILLLFYHSSSAQPFYTFENSFHSAPSVAIYVTAYNSTALDSTMGCATQLIESMVSSSGYHRNSSSINFFVLNQSACFSSASALGTASNSTQKPISECMNVSKSMPSIFINYSTVNKTIINAKSIYIIGDTIFLKECGIAPALS